jgi:glycine C-acetyltransferase
MGSTSGKMAADKLVAQAECELAQIRAAGLCKDERILATPQGVRLRLADGREVLNFCANNYLGLANDPRLVAAARAALDRWGYGLSSVRFICGTQELHKQLETRLSAFLGTDDAILYGSCFDANGGLFETLLGPEDAVISDEFNHASIIDGIRLCKARRLRYRHRDLDDLAARLRESADAHIRLIATDGVFSMHGSLAPLAEICDLAERHGASVMVDDSHATGIVGRRGRGTPEHFGVTGRVAVLTGTFGKALGGASGGFTAGPRPIIDLLRQRSRPYLFSNSLCPAIAATTLAALDVLEASTELQDRLAQNTRQFRDGMARRGFVFPAGDHPIVPIMLGDAGLAARMASMLLDQGIYVVGFGFPVVPAGQARIRVQVSAAHTPAELDFAMEAFARTREMCGAPASTPAPQQGSQRPT